MYIIYESLTNYSLNRIRRYLRMSTIQKHTICTLKDKVNIHHNHTHTLLKNAGPNYYYYSYPFVCLKGHPIIVRILFFFDAILVVSEPDFKINAKIWGFPSLKRAAKKLVWFYNITTQVWISPQRNTLQTNRKQLSKHKGSYILLKFGELWPTNGRDIVAVSEPPLHFLDCQRVYMEVI